MRNLLARVQEYLPEGRGLGGNVPTHRPGLGNRSWGGCHAEIVYNEGREGHHCGGHTVDQQPWQHTCPCGFRWAANS